MELVGSDLVYFLKIKWAKVSFQALNLLHSRSNKYGVTYLT